MAVPRKLMVVPNAATRELWRIAECGAIDELQAVLPQADINARNEHGMTALMRAAYHGRLQMVRVLLEHGADPNLARNDKFTALSLAAFFGYVEIVELLMGHGAKTDVSTRSGTSPRMWAAARSFGDVAQSLAKRRDEQKQSAPTVSPVSQPRPPSLQASPIAVRTLKEPPEIWDLVQEAPRQFNPRSAFIARIGSTKARFLITVAALLVLICVGVGAVWFVRDRKLLSPTPAVTAATTAPIVPAPVTEQQPLVQPAAETSNSVGETPVVVSEPAIGEVTTTNTRKPRPPARTRASQAPLLIQLDTQATTPPITTAPPKIESRPTAEVETRRTSTPPNPQLIAPPKTTQPKAKVIQWP